MYKIISLVFLLTLFFNDTLLSSLASASPSSDRADQKKASQLNESAVQKVKQKDYEGAEQDLLQAMAYSSDNAQIRKNLGSVYYAKATSALQSKNYIEAQRYIKNALEIEPANARYHQAYASTLFEEARSRERAGSNDQAMALYLQAAENDEKNLHLWLQAGHFAWKAQKLKEASFCLQKAKAIDPQNKNVKILESKLKGSDKELQYAVEDSEHFTLAAEQDYLWKNGEQDFLYALENAYNQVSYKLGVYPKNKIGVVFYPSHEFRDRWKMPARVVGHFDGKLRIPYTSQKIPAEVFEPILRHELTHAFVSQVSTATIPRWLNEGLAQWAEGKELSPKTRDALVTYQISRRVPDIAHLDQVISEQGNPYNGTEMTLAYMKSLTLVQFLVEQKGAWAVMNFIKEYGNLSEEKLMEKHFQSNRKDLETDWLKWIEAYRF